MLQVFQDWIENIKDVAETMPHTVKEVMQEPLMEAQMVDMNVAQMEAGRDAGNQAIAPPYAELTIAMKSMKGQVNDRVTLRDEGDFHSSLSIKYRTDRFEFYATDWKTPMLGQKYGYQIFGLTDANLGIIIGEAFPAILQEVRDQLF